MLLEATLNSKIRFPLKTLTLQNQILQSFLLCVLYRRGLWTAIRTHPTKYPTIAVIKTFDGFTYTIHRKLTADETGRYLAFKWMLNAN